jgi:hypothetical protein
VEASFAELAMRLVRPASSLFRSVGLGKLALGVVGRFVSQRRAACAALASSCYRRSR